MAIKSAAAVILPTAIENRPAASLKAARRLTRKHSNKQVRQIAAAIEAFGFNSPIIVDQDGRVLAGHGRLAAARLLKMAEVPTIRVEHLGEAERRAYALADNRIAELAGWDPELLALELGELEALDLDFDLEITGFDGAALERALSFKGRADESDDAVPGVQAKAVSRPGDVWILGPHRLVCGDVRDPETCARLMEGEVARMVFTDPPYNVKIDGNASGRGRQDRREFAMGSGEMTPDEFTDFLAEAMAAMAAVSADGSIHYVCMDWRHMMEMIQAGGRAYAKLQNLAVWAKDNASLGSFYRSQHELVFIFKKGTAPHLNTFGLGGKGRFRTNLWSYPSPNSFTAGRDEELELHPTVKPVAMIMDAIKDVSRRGEIVLDGFAGSGSTLIAAARTRRRARLVELDPLYVDVICRRWRRHAGASAVLAATGQSFEEVAAERGAGGALAA